MILEKEHLVMVDIDFTLLLWLSEENAKNVGYDVKIECPYDGTTKYFDIHWPNLKVLRNKHSRGDTIILWSANGYKWATAARDALKLQSVVTLCMSKPQSFIDDKLPAEFMGERIWLPIDSNYR